MKRVLVAGATGYLGRHMVRELNNLGFHVRALTRNRAKLLPVLSYIDEVFEGEITDPETLKGVCDGVDAVFSSIGITRQQDRLTYMDVDFQGNMNLLSEAKRCGISRFMYISVLNAPQLSHVRNVQAKLAFESELKNSGIDAIIVRPNAFFSDMKDYLEMARKGRVYLLGSGENRINPIHGADLARACARLLQSGDNEVPIGGPDVLTHNQIAGLAFESVGMEPKISRIPAGVARFLVRMVRLFTGVRVYGPLEFFVTVLSRDMIAPPEGTNHLESYFRELSSADNGPEK